MRAFLLSLPSCIDSGNGGMGTTSHSSPPPRLTISVECRRSILRTKGLGPIQVLCALQPLLKKGLYRVWPRFHDGVEGPTKPLEGQAFTVLTLFFPLRPNALTGCMLAAATTVLGKFSIPKTVYTNLAAIKERRSRPKHPRRQPLILGC